MSDQYRPQFTTSQEAAEEHAEERLEQGHYFGARVTTTEGSRQPSGVKSVPAPRPVQPAPSRLNYKPAAAPLTNKHFN